MKIECLGSGTMSVSFDYDDLGHALECATADLDPHSAQALTQRSNAQAVLDSSMARMGLDPRLRERVEDAFLEAVTSQVRGRHPERGGAPEARRGEYKPLELLTARVDAWSLGEYRSSLMEHEPASAAVECLVDDVADFEYITNLEQLDEDVAFLSGTRAGSYMRRATKLVEELCIQPLEALPTLGTDEADAICLEARCRLEQLLDEAAAARDILIEMRGCVEVAPLAKTGAGESAFRDRMAVALSPSERDGAVALVVPINRKDRLLAVPDDQTTVVLCTREERGTRLGEMVAKLASGAYVGMEFIEVAKRCPTSEMGSPLTIEGQASGLRARIELVRDALERIDTALADAIARGVIAPDGIGSLVAGVAPSLGEPSPDASRRQT